MSVIFYKFKSAKDYDTITFDGPTLTVWELKREIMTAKKLGDGKGFDLVLHEVGSGDEYKDDLFAVPRNTSVLVSRRPAVKPGKGTAQKYLASSGPSGGGRVVPLASLPMGGHAASAPGSGARVLVNKGARPLHALAGMGQPTSEITGETEEERIANMFKLQTEQWEETQDKMAMQKPIHRPFQRPPFRGGAHAGGSGSHQAGQEGGNGHGGWQKNDWQQNRAPPPGYICYRCGQKGHFISNCPTLGDSTFDRPKLKRTTGIPKIFLQTVDESAASEGGVMVTQNGELVRARPNDEAWATLSSRAQVLSGDPYELAPRTPALTCPLCSRLIRDATRTACCGTVFCEECIRGYLLGENDSAPPKVEGEDGLECPACARNLDLEGLEVAEGVRREVDNVLKEWIKSRGGSLNVGASTGAEDKTRGASPAVAEAPVKTSSGARASPGATTAPPPVTTSSVPVAPLPAVVHSVPVISRPKTAAKPFKFISKPSTTTDGPASTSAPTISHSAPASAPTVVETGPAPSLKPTVIQRPARPPSRPDIPPPEFEPYFDPYFMGHPPPFDPMGPVGMYPPEPFAGFDPRWGPPPPTGPGYDPRFGGPPPMDYEGRHRGYGDRWGREERWGPYRRR